jgi:hypothetical protein
MEEGGEDQEEDLEELNEEERAEYEALNRQLDQLDKVQLNVNWGRRLMQSGGGGVVKWEKCLEKTISIPPFRRFIYHTVVRRYLGLTHLLLPVIYCFKFYFPFIFLHLSSFFLFLHFFIPHTVLYFPSK